MATLTIRNVPDELHRWLREQAKRNRRSLNQEVIAELAMRVGLADEEAKKERVRKMTALAEDLRRELGAPLSAEQIRAGIEQGRR